MNKYTWLHIFTCTSTLLISAATAHAQSKPQFAFPVDCTLGKDCWTTNYVDTDSHPKSARDFTCGYKTFEGHKGTDFALKSRLEMEKGINVLAARDGKVLRIRDGETDALKTQEEYQSIRNQNKDCGNGIIIDHSNGLQTYYCHLKQNSISVEIGDEVKKGAAIAQIGQSGFATTPHLHFTVIWEGGQVDPFTAHLKDDGCGRFKDNLWEDDLAYEPYAIFNGGFSNTLPDFEAIKKGHPAPVQNVQKNGEALIYWVGFYHAAKEDKFSMQIQSPDGKVFIQNSKQVGEDRKHSSFRYIGRKLDGEPLQTGTYTGTFTYEKKGHPPKTITHTVEIN